MTTWLSPNFSLEELCKSSTALRNGWDNMAKGIFADNLRDLCENILQPIRNHFALPVRINSGYRSANINRIEGGATNSQHLYGQAADIEILGVHNADIWKFIVANLDYDQVIAEHLQRDDPNAGWVHVSYAKGKNRKDAISCLGVNHYVPGLEYVK